MLINQYQNNLIYKSSGKRINVPIELEFQIKIEKGGKLLSPLSVFEGNLYIQSDDYLACVDCSRKAILWEKEGGQRFGFPRDGHSGKIFLTADGKPACFETHTGQEKWILPDPETIVGASKYSILCYARKANPRALVCRSKVNGEELWRIPLKFGAPGAIAISGDIYVVQALKGIFIGQLQSGETIRQESSSDLLKRFFPNQTFRYWSIGPLVDDHLYVGFDSDNDKQNGVLICLSVSNGDLIWSYEMNSRAQPGRILYDGGKVYFDINPGWGSDNWLTCIDATTGELIYKTEENFTASGCANPIIVDNYFIGGYGKEVAFFDLDKQKFIWRYRHKHNKFVFGGSLIAFGGYLIASDISEKEIYWFKFN